MDITTEELSVLQTLANSYMEIASLPIQREKMNLWKSFNRRDEVRPMVMIDQIPWHELNYDGSLTCVTQEPFISQNFENQLKTEEDVEKIQNLNLSVEIQTSREWADISKFIFDGILPVRQAGGANIKLQIWDILSEFMGVENIYFDLADRPDFIHQIMNRMTQATLNGIHQANNLGLIPYAKQLAANFGMLYYGCCERLDDRLAIVQTIPNIKKISCSPWSNKENFAANLNSKIIMSNKPSPAFP